jgi:nucleoid-associated protein YgaU
MKISKYLLTVLSLLLLFTVSIVAQEQEEMTSEEWEAEMARLRSQKDQLTQEITDMQNQISDLKDKLNKMQTFEDCQTELYALVGATKADVDNFRNAVNELDGKIRRKEGPKADRQKDLDALKSNKISALPEFYDKVHNQMQAAMDAWVEIPQEWTYTVVRGDCLWNIAKKKDYYGNGFAWPKIYKANRDKIKNPDLIYPKQTFTIPRLTEEEKAKYDKIRKNYKPAPVQ